MLTLSSVPDPEPAVCGHHGLTSLWNPEPKYTFPSINCLGHGVIPSNKKVTKTKLGMVTKASITMLGRLRQEDHEFKIHLNPVDGTNLDGTIWEGTCVLRGGDVSWE